MTIELTDAQLVERCRAGEAEAWNELVERFSRYVYAISVRAFGLSEADAEDVFQDVFARTFERLDSLRDDSRCARGSRSSPGTRASTASRRSAARSSSRNPRPSRRCGDRAARRRAHRPRGLARPLRRLPRDPRPLLRAGRELPLDRRGARAPCRHDREPHLPLPRQAARATRGKKSGHRASGEQ